MSTTHTNKLHRVEDTVIAASAGRYTTGYVTSKDGTRIEYLQLGRGPGVVVLHGAMESARSHLTLAEGLADSFTVYLPERRGHQLGYPFANNYSMQKEVEDLEALLEETGSRNVFGVSAGGLACLQAARILPSIGKIALYEPALIVNGFPSIDFLPRYEQEIAQGRIAAALISGMKGAQLGPSIFNAIPRRLLEFLTTMALKQEEKNAQPGDILMRDLAPTLYYDFCLVAEMADSAKEFKCVQSGVLLLGGERSPSWLKVALDVLEKTLPHVRRVEFPGLDHGGSSDISSTNRSGQPHVVAAELRRFFAR